MMAWTYIGVLSLAAAALTYLLASQGGLAYRGWESYSRVLKDHFDFLFITQSAGRVAAIHISLCFGWLFLAMVMESLFFALWLPVFAVIPTYVLQRRHNKKRSEISEQLAPWLSILANSLKSSPNITDAFGSSVALVQSPLREEIDLLVKEVRLGEHLDRAMHRSASRLDSPLYSSVMTTLLVARKTGGHLPKVLDKSSATLREMERLAGVVRTKTAEGKAQTFVLAILPFVMTAALHKVDPAMVPGLAKSGTGQLVLAASILMWLGSIAVARRIVNVDI